MKQFLLIILIPFLSATMQAQTFDLNNIYASWLGKVKVEAYSSDLDEGCLVNVEFRLTLSRSGYYNIEVFDSESNDLVEWLCYTSSQVAFETFLAYHEIQFERFEVYESDGNYYLRLNFSGLSGETDEKAEKLQHIRQEASDIQILYLTENEMKLRINLITSSLKSQKILLIREE